MVDVGGIPTGADAPGTTGAPVPMLPGTVGAAIPVDAGIGAGTSRIIAGSAQLRVPLARTAWVPPKGRSHPFPETVNPNRPTGN